MKGELRYRIVIFGGHLCRHLGKNATDLDDFSTNSYSTTFTSYESTLYLLVYLKGELRYIRFGISAAMLAAILEKNIFTYSQIL